MGSYLPWSESGSPVWLSAFSLHIPWPGLRKPLEQPLLLKPSLQPTVTWWMQKGLRRQMEQKRSTSWWLPSILLDIAQLLLDVPNNLTLSSGGEGVATLSEDLHQVVGQLTASQVEPEDGVGEGITFIDGDGVGDTISRVHDDTGGTAGSIQGQDSLDSNIHSGHVEGLEHDLGHLLPVGLGVEGSLPM